jgi:hypothetical protein
MPCSQMALGVHQSAAVVRPNLEATEAYTNLLPTPEPLPDRRSRWRGLGNLLYRLNALYYQS